jgi:hypothetical protein
MARARNIKPGFFTNEVLGQEDPLVGLTFIGLWCLADCEGRLEDRPVRIKAELFPYREKLDINRYLTVLERTEHIQRYAVDGHRYIQVVNFTKHQSPHHTEKSRKYPDPPSIPSKQPLTPLDNGYVTVTTRSDSLIPDSLIPDPRSSQATPPEQEDTGFGRFWDVYPKKRKRGDAEKAWKAAHINGHLGEILAAIEKQKRSKDWTKEGGQFIPYPASWIRARGWEDEIEEQAETRERMPWDGAVGL